MNIQVYFVDYISFLQDKKKEKNDNHFKHPHD
jgi:hypothetical protein